MRFFMPIIVKNKKKDKNEEAAALAMFEDMVRSTKWYVQEEEPPVKRSRLAEKPHASALEQFEAILDELSEQ